MTSMQSRTSTFTGLAVVVVNFGSHALLETHLGPMTSQLPGARIFVVDNWFSPEERDAVTQVAESRDWTLVPLDSNTGFGTGCNHGVAAAIAAGAQEILLINPDATIDADSTTALLHAVRVDPMALAAPRILKADGNLWSAGMDISLASGDSRGWHRRSEFGHDTTIEWFTGACLMLSAALWEASGGFDDDYFLYWEDVDLSARVQSAGGRLELVPEATAHHDVGGTQVSGSSAAKSELYYYYNIRNRSLFARKHLALADRRRWKDSARKSAWAIVLRGGRRTAAPFADSPTCLAV